MGVISEETLLRNEAIRLKIKFPDEEGGLEAYKEIYAPYETDENLKYSFSILHKQVIDCIEIVKKSRLTDTEVSNEDYFKIIKIYIKCQEFLNDIETINKSYSIEKDIKLIFEYLKNNCKNPWESKKIPITVIKDIGVKIYEPVFIKEDYIELPSECRVKREELIKVESGSYGTVKYYHDPTYDCKVAVKIAKSSLTDTEKARFKQEYDVLKDLDSPYIIKVFNYFDDNDRPEYTMEYVPKTLNTFIEELEFEKNSNSIRISLVRQVFKAMKYVHSKKHLHRDLSYTNILVKKHDDKSYIIKLCDFGLVKTVDSTLTCKSTDARGSLNEPRIQEDIGSYSKIDEVYSLTQIIFYIMTGDKHASLKKHNESEQLFYNTGINSDYDKRYADLDKLEVGFNNTEWQDLNK